MSFAQVSSPGWRLNKYRTLLRKTVITKQWKYIFFVRQFDYDEYVDAFYFSPYRWRRFTLILAPVLRVSKSLLAKTNMK